MKNKRSINTSRKITVNQRSSEMSFKTPPISPMKGLVSQFFSNNESYEEDLSILNELNKDILSEKKSTNVSRNIRSDLNPERVNNIHQLKESDLMPKLGSIKSDSHLNHFQNKELNLMPIIAKSTIEEIKMTNNFNKNKFEYMQQDKDTNSLFNSEVMKLNWMKSLTDDYTGMDDYIGVYSSTTARERNASSSPFKYNKKDISIALKDSFSKVKSTDAPVLFTWANKLGVKGSNVFPKLKFQNY